MTSNKMPFVSIIIPVYNGARFLVEALDSCLAQTYSRFEMIVVDDGSTDKTWKILKRYRKRFPKIVRIYHLPENQGESPTANFAIGKSRGTYIARMDSDDLMHRDRIVKQVRYLENNPFVVAVGSQARVIDEKGRRIGLKRTPLTNADIYHSMAFVNPMIHPSVMYRKALLPNLPHLYTHALDCANDYNTYFELLRFGKFANLPMELVSYRVHGANKSLNNLKEKFWTDTKIRLNAIKRLNYKAPFLMFPAIFLQMILVTILPEKTLRELLFYVRGIKTARPPKFKFSFEPYVGYSRSLRF